MPASETGVVEDEEPAHDRVVEHTAQSVFEDHDDHDHDDED
jgi:hypothetical protein